MASSSPRSALKSSNSPSRSWRTVSFEERQQNQTEQLQLLKNSPALITKVKVTSTPSPYYHSPNQRSPSSFTSSSSFTSKDKRDYSRELHASFSSEHGLSIDEITCAEIDDILPKTDYTYAKTASYSPETSQKKYNSPNMSRRRLRSSQAAFLSDDEEEFSKYTSVNSSTRVYSRHSQDFKSKKESSTIESQFSETGIQKLERLGGQDMMTSTPLNSHGNHLISTKDNYYELRSGSRARGSKNYYRNQISSRSDGDALLYEQVVKPDVVPGSAYESHMDVASQQRSARNVTTVTETTTTTTTFEPNNRVKESSQKNAYIMEDLNERKLMLDESQTEKEWNEKEYKLNHLYGLDSEEEISDVDDVTESDLAAMKITHRYHSQKGSSVFSFITTFFTTLITTVTSTFSGGTSSVVKPLTMAAYKTIVTPGKWLLQRISFMVQGGWNLQRLSNLVPGRWLLQRIADVVQESWLFQRLADAVRGGWLLQRIAKSASWLITRSATFLLWDIDVKQKRRRGCCCCFLPLLFLLPLLLLAGYYTRDVQHQLGSYMSGTNQLLSSPWSYLWFTTSSTQEVPFSKHSPPVPTPVTIPLQATDHTAATQAVHQVDMKQIYAYIQQAVAESTAANKDNMAAGLNREQVESIVWSLLAGKMNEVTSGLEGQVDAIKILLQGSVTSQQHKIVELESAIKANTQTQQTLADNLNQAKTLVESTYAGQNVLWLAEVKSLKEKLLNLTQEVNYLSSQNAALTAMLTNCCRNNSAIADIVRVHVASILSQMSTDEDSQLVSLLTRMGEHYVDKSDLDRRLSAISVDIMKNLKVMMTTDVKEQSNAPAEVETTVIAGMNESAVKSIIEEALVQFSADRVGMPDFALESAGGSVVNIRCSETYYKKTALVSVFGIPLWYTSNSPRTVIQPNVHPGECWAFTGPAGFIVFQLSHPIMPTGFTLEHIPRSLAPKGDISSAPKEFAVLGLTSESDIQGINLGNYTYFDNGKPIQYFPIQNGHPGIFQFIELQIMDNHGNKEYTCVYRFRVHGLP